MKDRFRFILSRLTEKLWVKPLLVCLVSITIAFASQFVDQLWVFQNTPDVKSESIEMLLEVISASMLVMAVFAVGSMLAAYQSASRTATPRVFSLIISDDVSQNALSTFIGAFIFSIVAQVALINGYYEKEGRFVLFIITIAVFVIVIASFVKWVDCIAHLGRLSSSIKKIEIATKEALCRIKNRPCLGAMKSKNLKEGFSVFSSITGYIQRIDIALLQSVARSSDMQIEVAVLPGKFVTHNLPLAYIKSDIEITNESVEVESVLKAFCIDRNRTFDDDPRFGLIALSEIASRALSPAVNDPGTAIEITGSFVRLFTDFAHVGSKINSVDVEFDRISTPEISYNDMFEDAFSAIARDGANNIEVITRIQKALDTLSTIGCEATKSAAFSSAKLVLLYAERELRLPYEAEKLRAVSAFLDS